MFQNIDRALHQQLLGAVKDNFILVLHKPHIGYIGSTTLGMLTHLYTTYTVISNADWPMNYKRLHEAYYPTDPIKVMWWHINNAVSYDSNGSTPYPTMKIVNNSYHLILNADVFAVVCWEWNNQTVVVKTLPHLKVFFIADKKEWRPLIQNKMGTPYGAVHNATENTDDGYIHQDTVDAISKLATATAINRMEIAQLKSIIISLTKNLTTVNQKLLVDLQTKRGNRRSCRGSDRAARGCGYGSGPPAPEGTAGVMELETPIH